jgi:hypothetical protein
VVLQKVAHKVTFFYDYKVTMAPHYPSTLNPDTMGYQELQMASCKAKYWVLPAKGNAQAL